MREIKDVTLGEVANLSYIDLPTDLGDELKKGGEITLKDLSEFCIDDYLDKEKNGTISYQEQDILNTLKKCQDGEYKDYKIKGYENDNGNTGFVGYAIETKPGEVIIASRGSEVPGANTENGWEDWIDNVQIATKYETIQQEAAKGFLNEVGVNYDSIYLTGHSKGGNNALYATITADYEIRLKIENCVTFNAPGFSDKFIKDKKFAIDQLNKIGVFKEYQGSSDLVSSIMNNVSIPLIIKQKELDKTFFERLKGLDDHYIYAMEMDGDTFILEKDGEKALIPVFVNNLVAGLTATLTDKEIDEIISLVENIMNKDEDAGVIDIVKMLVESGVNLSTAKVIVLQIISEASTVYLKESPIVPVAGIGYIMDFYRDTKTFIYANIARVKNYIRDGFVNLSKNIVKAGLSNIRESLNRGFNINIGTISIGNSVLAISNLISSGVSSNKCLVTTEDINESLKVYKTELTNIKSSSSRIDLAMNKLVKSGWTGQASFIFYSVRFVMFKASISTIEEQLSHMVRYLEKAKIDFDSRKLEEDRLVGVLA